MRHKREKKYYTANRNQYCWEDGKFCCCCSVSQPDPTLFNPIDQSTPGFPYPSQSPRACSNSCPSSQWCHPTISSSVVPFSSCLQSFPASGSFLMSQLFTSGGRSIGHFNISPFKSKRLLIPWLQSPSTVILEPKKIKSVTISIVSPSICHEMMGPDAMILSFLTVEFRLAFSLSSFTFFKRLFSYSLLSAIKVVSLHIWGYWYFSQQSWFQLVIHPDWHFARCTLHIS